MKACVSPTALCKPVKVTLTFGRRNPWRGGPNGVVMLESDYVLENGTEINLMTLNGEPLDLHIHGVEPKLILQEGARVHIVEHAFRAQIQGHQPDALALYGA